MTNFPIIFLLGLYDMCCLQWDPDCIPGSWSFFIKGCKPVMTNDPISLKFQIIIFGSQRQSIVEFFGKSNLVFKHLLLKDWNAGYETMPYPPSTGQYAIYEVSGLYDHINNALEQVSLHEIYKEKECKKAYLLSYR